MKELLYAGVGLISRIHDKIMRLNNAFEANLSDKELHFLVIGILGLCMIFVIYPLFKYLAKRGHEMVIAWIYVFTVLVVITFAIEIGQKITGTGEMDFADVVAGLYGVLAFFAVYTVYRLLMMAVSALIGKHRKKK